MASNLKSYPEDKPITLTEEQIQVEKKNRTTYIIVGIVILFRLYIIVHSKQPVFEENILISISSILSKMLNISTPPKDFPILTAERIQKMVRRHITFFSFTAIILLLLAGALTIPEFGGPLKHQHMDNNHKEPANDTLTGILFSFFFLFLVIVIVNFEKLRPYFVSLFLAGMLSLVVLMFRLYLFNTNVYHTAILTIIMYFFLFSIFGFIYFSMKWSPNVHMAIIVLAYVLITTLTTLFYYGLEKMKDDTNQYRINEHKYSRPFIYISIITVIILFVMFQFNVLFKDSRAEIPFIADTGVRELFARYRESIMDRIRDPRIKMAATPFIYIISMILEFIVGTVKMPIEYLQELKASV